MTVPLLRPRPAPTPILVVQDDRFEESASVSICLLTSYHLDGGIFRVPIEPAPGNGLREPTFAMADKITTVPRSYMPSGSGR
ncbi:MAG TPA: type II toxin-antitoxin system PemK/MazF family toxin [Allosphingosinicella sp.]|nr:type II toxin-antitoxin system PemK/MazF family toxin [Allosphingosinicella sp.]